VHGDPVLSAVTLRNRETGEERTVQTNWLFVCIGGMPHTEWAEEVGIARDEAGYLVTGPDLSRKGERPRTGR
jgi:thioredoxin reductase (NADPH)